MRNWNSKKKSHRKRLGALFEILANKSWFQTLILSHSKNQGLHRNLAFFQLVARLTLFSLILDCYLAPPVFKLLQGSILTISPATLQALTLCSVALVATPLFREQILALVLSSQTVQRQAHLLKGNFQTLFSALIALAILIDTARRLLPLGIEYVIGIIAIGLILLPLWYQMVKNNSYQRPDIANIPLSQDIVLRRSAAQFDRFFLLPYLVARVAHFVSLGLFSILHVSRVDSWLVSGITAIILLSEHPRREDLIRICRKCGLWSHRSLQIDGYCPGCAKLRLKERPTEQNNQLLIRASHLLEKIDRGLLAVKLRTSRDKNAR